MCFCALTITEGVFAEVAPLVQSCLDGYNVCIFAYGQTGSGKTHTMEGPAHDRGVNSRALNEVFRVVNERGVGSSIRYNVKVSCVEIYNEQVRDLFVDARTYREQAAKSGGQESKLEIRQGPNGPYIPDLTEMQVNTVAAVQELMVTRAFPNRQVACTSMNSQSSRSHLLLFVNVVGHNQATEEKTFGKLILIGMCARTPPTNRRFIIII